LPVLTTGFNYLWYSQNECNFLKITYTAGAVLGGGNEDFSNAGISKTSKSNFQNCYQVRLGLKLEIPVFEQRNTCIRNCRPMPSIFVTSE